MEIAQGALREIPKPGETLAGKYRIERPLAEGGMGVVVEATHIQLEERVAIKFLRPEMLGEGNIAEITARFLREARAAIKIRSEHVVRVYDVSALDTGVPYIVMELLQGQDLDQLLTSKGALPTIEAVDHVLQACEALAEAHALGIVHRDLKPANLFLCQNASGMPVVKVLDFGISKVASAGDMSMTSTQAVMGSPLYMSPEQMRATKDADARSDIWAMGVILYELMAGKPPFAGVTMTQVCAAILQDVPTPLGSLRRDVPPGLERVVLKCLEKAPGDRFASIAELSAALAPYASLVGQEAARRATRTAQFASSSRLPTASVSSEHILPAPATPRASTGATSTAWGDEHTRKTKARSSKVAGAVFAAALLLGAGSFFLFQRSTARSPDVATQAVPAAAPSPSVIEPVQPPAPAAPAVESPSAQSVAPPTSVAAATAVAPVAAAKPAGATPKRPSSAPKISHSSTPAPAPAPAQPGKANWNERK